jgi:Ser/Thr protein kinase RdoA (MazF antagonist)
MWDSVLGRLDRAAVSDPVEELWGADRGSLAFVGSGANVVFRFEVQGAGRYLRITHAKLRSHAELASTLDFVLHLHRSRVPVCPPVPSLRGRLIEELPQGTDPFLGSVVAEVPGRPIDTEPPQAAAFAALGRTLGQLHRAAERYEPRPGAQFVAWERLWRGVHARLARDDAPAWAEVRRIDNWVRALPRESGDFGLTHGDLNTGNLRWDGRRVHVIDFDEPVYHWFAADVARPFRELTQRPAGERREALESLLRAYRTVRPFDERWAAALPQFMRMKDLDIYAWASDSGSWHGPVLPGGERRDAVLAQLRERFAAPSDG